MFKQTFIYLICSLSLLVIACGDGNDYHENCLPQTEVCDGLDNNCNGIVDGKDEVKDCDDGVSCTVDSCEDGQCRHRGDNSLCDDGLYCNGKEFCDSILDCQKGEAPDCSSLTAQCRRGICNEYTDSCDSENFAAGEPCDDGLWCTIGEHCLAGGICGEAEPRDCSAATEGQCQFAVCNEEADICQAGFVEQDTPCDDDLWCTVDDVCDGLGSCLGTTRDCSQFADQCNKGLCDEAEDNCYAAPEREGESCDDGLFCQVNEVCMNGSCLGGILRDCDDGLFCNGQESCNEDADSCDSAGNPCSETECNTCQEDNDSCFDAIGTICGDGSSSECDEPDTCDGAGVCLANWWPEESACADDSNSCTLDICQSGSCAHPLVANDCGSYECGLSPSGCHHCGNCPAGQACRDNQCINLYQWSRSFGGEGNEKIRDLAIDSQGDIYLAGYFSNGNQIDFDEYNLIQPVYSQTESFLVKLQDNVDSGHTSWAKNFNYSEFDEAILTAIDNSDNVYVAGVYIGQLGPNPTMSKSIDLGGGPLASNPESENGRDLDIYIGRFSPLGEYIYSAPIYGSWEDDDEYPRAMVIGQNGYVYLAGSYKSGALGGCADGPIFRTGGSPPGADGTSDLFVTSFLEDLTGADYCLFPWDNWLCNSCGILGPVADTINGDGQEYTVDLALDNNFNLYLTGSFDSSNLEVGLTQLATRGYNDIFLAASRDSFGDYSWVEQFGGPQNDYSPKVAVDNAGYIYLAGHFNKASQLDFGNGVLPYAGGNNDVYVVKLDSTRYPVWSRNLGGSGDERISPGDLAVSNDGNLYVLGYTDSADFDAGNGPLNNAGDDDIFLIKLDDQDGSLIWDMSFGGDGGEWPTALAVGNNGELIIGGTFWSSAIYIGADKLENKGSEDIFVIKLLDPDQP